MDKGTGERSPWTLMAEAIAAGDQDGAERICRQGCRQITEALRRILTDAGDSNE